MKGRRENSQMPNKTKARANRLVSDAGTAVGGAQFQYFKALGFNLGL